jgi:RNA methyltransferase, TrmH family
LKSEVLSKNKIKYLNSLQQKKYRSVHKAYLIEGDKLVKEAISQPDLKISCLIATQNWLDTLKIINQNNIEELIVVNENELSKISNFVTPGQAIAVLPIIEKFPDKQQITNELSLVLDTVQDPGNLGTILRIADWFGIRRIFCSTECVDCYNPKVVQASMGAVLRTTVFYDNLETVFENYKSTDNFLTYGTFLDGNTIYTESLGSKGFIVLGNESKGISPDLWKYIDIKLHIPNFSNGDILTESLNVSTAAAIVCSEFRRRG